MDEKIAIITGGATRLGREFAQHLLDSGYITIVTYCKNKAGAEEFAVQHPGKVLIHQLDFTSQGSIDDFLSYINSLRQKPNVLVNSASSFKNDNFANLPPENLQAHFATNLFGPMQLMQNFAKNAQDGNIINICDYTIFTTGKKFVSYNLSKNALWEATKIAALSLAPKIRVNAICFGPTLQAPNESDEHFAKICSEGPLGTKTQIWEILSAIDFILNTKSLTGQMINLDGGRVLINANY